MLCYYFLLCEMVGGEGYLDIVGVVVVDLVGDFVGGEIVE